MNKELENLIKENAIAELQIWILETFDPALGLDVSNAIQEYRRITFKNEGASKGDN